MKKLGETIGKFVVKHRILIVIASILLCIPSLFGYINTDINYDILVYLPEDIDTMKGQDILAEDFDMGSFAMCVVENMSSKDVLDLEEKYKDIEGVVKVVSANDMIGTTIPKEMLPSDVTKQFKKGQKPAINYGVSVSRLGGAVQTDEMKKLGSSVRLKLLSYLETKEVYELANMDEMSQELREKMKMGKTIEQALRQNKFSPLSQEEIKERFKMLGEDAK